MKIDVRSNTKAIVAQIGADRKSITKAQVQAINRTADRLRTQAGREVRAVYNVTLRGVRQASKIDKARAGSKYPRAEVSFSGRPINLVEFGAKAKNPWNEPGRAHKPGGGVTVKIKRAGGRKLIKGAFLTTLVGGPNAGKQGAFRRTGAGRYPIRFLPSLSIPQMVAARAVERAILRFGDKRYSIEFAAALKNQLRLNQLRGR